MAVQTRDVRTVGYVLRRTNYGEADRILDLITPLGKMPVVARGVRKMKSKLAGSVEPFTRSDFSVHFGRGELGILTGAKMQRFYGGILGDLGRMELATQILRRVDAAAERVGVGVGNGEVGAAAGNGEAGAALGGGEAGVAAGRGGGVALGKSGGGVAREGEVGAEEYFLVVDQSLDAINAGENLGLVEAWFVLNLQRIMGEEVNLYRDAAGRRLEREARYRWDGYEKALSPVAGGEFGVDEIKMLRLMASNDLRTVRKIKFTPQILEPILRLVRGL